MSSPDGVPDGMELVAAPAVDLSTDQGLVIVGWGASVGHLSPSAAREYAYGLLQAATQAEIEAAVVQHGRQIGSMTDDEAMDVLAGVREHLRARDTTPHGLD